MGTQTAGHCEQGGLRGHSMGGGYPETVIGVGDGYAAFNTLTGDLGPVRGTYSEARARARRPDEKRLDLLTGRA